MAQKSFMLHYVLPAIVLGVILGVAKLKTDDEADKRDERPPPVHVAAPVPVEARDFEAEKLTEIARLEELAAGLKPTPEGRIEWASAIARILILNGFSINVQAIGPKSTTLEVAVFGGDCTREGLEGLRTKAPKAMGFVKLRCAPDGPEIRFVQGKPRARPSSSDPLMNSWGF